MTKFDCISLTVTSYFHQLVNVFRVEWKTITRQTFCNFQLNTFSTTFDSHKVQGVKRPLLVTCCMHVTLLKKVFTDVMCSTKISKILLKNLDTYNLVRKFLLKLK